VCPGGPTYRRIETERLLDILNVCTAHYAASARLTSYPHKPLGQAVAR
jgi:hypothetical protein